jgi:hypothetical protein
MFQGMDHFGTRFVLVPNLSSHRCSENASGMKFIIDRVALNKSLGFSVLQLPSLSGDLITLIFQDYARIQFIQTPNTY